MALERLLHHLHLLADGLLGILLHARVEGGINLEAIAFQVQYQAIGLGNVLDLAGHGFAEVGRNAVIVALDGILQVDGQRRYRVILLLRQVAAVDHVLEHHVAARQAVLGVNARVVGAGGLEQSHEHGALLKLELPRRCPEVGVGSRLDADDPFLALHDEHLHAGNIAQQSC